VLEAYLGYVVDEIGDEAAHDGRGERGVLLQWAKEIEGERLRGKEVGPQTLDVDDSADLAVGDLVVDKWDEGGVDQVHAGPTHSIADAAAEATWATVGVDITSAWIIVLLAPKALAQACDGTEARVGWLGAAVAAQQFGRQQRQWIGEVHCGLRGQTGWLPACVYRAWGDTRVVLRWWRECGARPAEWACGGSAEGAEGCAIARGM
jgi:hypothetical protein